MDYDDMVSDAAAARIDDLNQREHDNGEHSDAPVEGCWVCDAEAEDAAADAVAV